MALWPEPMRRCRPKDAHRLTFCLSHLQPTSFQCLEFHLQQVGPPGLHAALQHGHDPVPGSHRPLQPLLPHDTGGAHVFGAQHHLDRDGDVLGKFPSGRGVGTPASVTHLLHNQPVDYPGSLLLQTQLHQMMAMGEDRTGKGCCQLVCSFTEPLLKT